MCGMTETGISIAIETSCRHGGVALGTGDRLLEERPLGASRRHAARLAAEIADLFASRGLVPTDLDHLYISEGPGSYTGLRVGMAYAATLAAVLPDLKLVAVPTPLAVAERIADRRWERAAVLLAAKNNAAWAVLVERVDGTARIGDGPVVAGAGELLDRWSGPLLVTGEGTGYVDFPDTDRLEIVPEHYRFPTPGGVWTVGRQLAADGAFTAAGELRPRYARRPEAVRLWEKKERDADRE